MSLYSGPELDKNQANFAPLTPVSVLKRTERVYPDLPAQIHGNIRRNWGEVAERCKRLASALSHRGVGKGDTVALIAPNIPEALECALAIPMLGAVLNANNVRLDAATLGFILEHGEAKVLLVDTEFSALAREAVTQSGRDLFIVDIEDSEGPGGDCIGELTYEALLAEGSPDFPYTPPNASAVASACLRYPFMTILPRNATSPWVSPSQGTGVRVSGSSTSTSSCSS